MSFTRRRGVDPFRRGGQRGAGTPPKLSCIHGFANGANRYQTANGEGPRGNGTGFWVAAFYRQTASASAAAMRLFTCGTAATGYYLDISTINTLGWRVVDGSAVLRAVVHDVSGDIGTDQLVVCIHDGTNIRMYYGRAEVSAGPTVCTGYSAPPGTSKFLVGVNNPGNAAFSNGCIYGIAGGDGGAPNLATIQAYFDSVKLARDIQQIASITDNEWSVKRSGIGAPAEIADTGGSGEGLDEVGTMAQGTNAPNWGW